MAAISTETKISGHSTFLKTLVGTVAVAALLVASAGISQAADSNDRIVPPSAADVAILRGLLALQHPSLRSGGAMHAAPAVTRPTVVTDPGKSLRQPTSATEGEACLSPADGSRASCTFGTDAKPDRTAFLKASFRAALDRSMAAAGYAAPRL